jgi:hypothetical protein
MEERTWTGNDVTCITNVIVQIQPFHAAHDATTICMKVLALKRIVFYFIRGWNLIMTDDNHLYNGQYYATNLAFNVLIIYLCNIISI